MVSHCSECTLDMPILARGLCNRCYLKAWRRGTFTRYTRARPRTSTRRQVRRAHDRKKGAG